MDPKLLTESGWKATALKFKIKDNGLQRALAAYEQTDDEEHDELIKKISSMSQLVGNLKKSREVAAEEAAVKYLTDLVAALELELREVNKAKALAKKTEAVAAKTEAMTQKKAEAEAKKRDEEEEDD